MYIYEFHIDLGNILIIFTHEFGTSNRKQQNQTLIIQTNLTLVFINERIVAMDAFTAVNNPPSSLSNWHAGNEGTVAEVSGPTRFAARLRELGLLPGVRLRLLRTGSALVVQVGETRLAIRSSDAEAIRVCADLSFATTPTANLATS